METLKREIVIGTDYCISVEVENTDMATVQLYLDIAYSNVKVAEFVLTNMSPTLSILKLSKEKTKLLRSGIHKGDLIILDETGALRPICKYEFNLLINRTDTLTHTEL